MLFSYALLFAMLTTFMAAARTSRSKKFSKPEPEPNPVPALPATGTALLNAADYLTYGSHYAYDPGWVRSPSLRDTANTMGLVFSLDGSSVYFRRISTGDGRITGSGDYVSAGDVVSAGLTEVHPWQDVAKLGEGSTLGKEIIGSWHQRETGQKMEITYDEKEKQFHVTDILLRPKKKEEKEMTFEPPKGLVPLVGPDCNNTAAGYLAAASGKWLSSQPAGNPVEYLFFDIHCISHLDVLLVAEKSKSESVEEKPVPVGTKETVGRLIGLWYRKRKGKREDRIEIKHDKEKGLLMEVLQ